MLDCVVWELENKMFPWIFMHCEPIRSCCLRSHDLCTSFQPSDVKASKMVGMPAQFEALPPLEEWHINLEVGSQVYQLLKGFSNFGKQPYGLTLHPHCTGEGFRTRFEKTLPQVVTAPHLLRGFLLPQSK